MTIETQLTHKAASRAVRDRPTRQASSAASATAPFTPPAPGPPLELSGPPREPGEPLPLADQPPPIPAVCPMCSAPTKEVPILDTRRTRGWWCQLSRSLHFWQWRSLAWKEWMAKRRYAIPPVLGSDGIPDYPGVSFDDLEQARLEMQADRARWHAQGYDPKD